jgi:hypothetical protein
MTFKAKMISWFGTLGKFLAVLFGEVLHKELDIVVPLASQVVSRVAADPTLLTSSTKRDAAIAIIATTLIKEQISVGEDVIRFAIELAYQDFKKGSNVAVTTPTIITPTTTPGSTT